MKDMNSVMKKIVLPLLLLCALISLCACSKPPVVQTAIGDFEFDQDINPSMEDDFDNELTAADGNTLLEVSLTPAEGNEATEDQAYAYFWSGTQAVVDENTYDMKVLIFEPVGAKICYKLIFEIAENGYDTKNQPTVRLNLPADVPAETEPVEAEAGSTEANPTESTETSS